MTKLGDFIELKRGYDLPSTTRVAGDFPLISSSGPTDSHNEAKVKGPGVVTGRYGTIGQVFYVVKDFWPLNTTLYVRDFKCNDPRFIYYFLQTLDWNKFHDKSGVPGVNRNDAHLEPVSIPERPLQKKIASILSALDDKIELNRRMNETLEALTQAVFKDWFVDFGPVRRKLEGITNPVAILGGLIPDPTRAQKTATLFPATFNDDGLPEGWSLWAVENLFELSYGKSLPKTERQEGLIPVYGSGGITGSHSKPLVKGPGIIVGRKGTVGSLYWENSDFYAIDTVFYVRPASDVSLVYLWQLLTRLGLENMNTDAAVPGLNRSNVYRLEVPKVGPELILAYTEIVLPLRQRQQAALAENQTLTETRDYLLPKLMSGEVRVRDAEKMVEDHHVVTSQEAKSGPMVFGADLFGAPMLSPDQEIERDAVIVASVVKSFQRGRDVVGNVRMQKSCYFTRRRAGLSISSFDKKAAGPYDANLNHEGGKPEAMAKGWIMEGTSAGGGKVFDGSVPGAKAKEAEALVNQYGLAEAIGWVAKHLASKSREELECLATVDFAMQTLRTKGHTPTFQLVKADIAGDAEWKPKLSKPHFSDSAIRQAIQNLDEWFAEKDNTS